MTADSQQIDDELVGVILSGGAGKRMQGADKGLQPYQGKPLLQHTIERIENQVSSLVICANRNISQYQTYGYEVIKDKSTGFEGPLAGISVALEQLLLDEKNSANYALITSCDTPKIPDDYASRLLAKIEDKPVAAVHDGARRQTLHCLISRTVWAELIKSFEQGERALWQWQDRIGLSEVDFGDQAQAFSNFNTLDDLNR